MKIGILTYHWVSNFGANLQTLSTYRYIQNAGHEPVIINWIPKDVEEVYEKNVLECQNAVHKQFAKDNYVNITSVCRNGEQIANEIMRLGISRVMIGSDAVFTNLPKMARWSFCKKGIVHITPKSDCSFPNPFWGDFMQYLKNPIKIVAISASAQNMPYKKIWFSKEKNAYGKALERFDNITVRDVWTQNMVKFVTKGALIPDITPDPVFGFEQNVKPKKIDFVSKKLDLKKAYVLFSAWKTIKDKNWIVELESLFDKEDIIVVGLPKTTMRNFESPLKYNLSFPISPMEWYDSIKYSAGYIGELMHPILVSLHNSIPVYSFDTYGFTRWNKLDEKSSKIYQILSRYNLLSSYYNKNYSASLPKPEDVVKKISSFDKTNCAIIANEMWKEYDEMMKKSLVS